MDDIIDISNLRNEDLRKALTLVWKRVESERTPFQKYFFNHISYYFDVLGNTMACPDHERKMRWVIEDIEIEKFYKYLGFEFKSFVVGKNNETYYVHKNFGHITSLSNLDYIAIQLVKVDDKFDKNKVRFGDTFNCYFDLGRTLYGTTEESYTNFYKTIKN